MTHQEAVTVHARVRPDAVEALRAALEPIGLDPAGNALLPFGELDRVHFARFVVLDASRDIDGREIPPALVYAANVDAPGRDHVAALARWGEAMDRVWGHCEGYPAPGARTEASREEFMRRRRIRSQAFYVNTVGRPVRQVRDEEALRRRIEAVLDAGRWEGRTPEEVRQAVVRECAGDSALAWALRPARKPPFWWRARERARFVMVLLALVLLSPLLLPVAAAWLLAVRALEKRDAGQPPLRLSAQERARLAVLEDRVVQNQFSAVGNVKHGWLRRTTVRVLLAAADFACRHHFNRGDLGTVKLLGLNGVDTIHFAQWIVVDEGRRVLFLSNYDGSLTSYMDDFVNKVAWGLNAVFSHGERYPATRWMVLDGADDEQAFKAFLQKHQIPTQVWYTAYPELTARNVTNNAAIRAGLSGALGPAGAEGWARRL